MRWFIVTGFGMSDGYLTPAAAHEQADPLGLPVVGRDDEPEDCGSDETRKLLVGQTR